MKEKRGFTLIELLAVIVILAIIALIAMPIVLNMINNARRKAAISSMYGFIDSIEYSNGLSDVNSNYTKIPDGDYTNDDMAVFNTLKMKGKRPTSITSLNITNGGVTSAEVCINEFVVKYEKKEADVIRSCKTPKDTTAPEVVIDSTSSTTKSITINFTAEDLESGIKSSTCKTLGENSKTGTGTSNTCTINGLTKDVDYTVVVEVTNGEGIPKTSESRVVRTNNFGSVVITATPSENTYAQSRTIELSGGADGQWLEYKIDDGEWAKYTTAIPVNENDISIYIKLTDGTNSSNETIYNESKIDKTAPTCTLKVTTSGVSFNTKSDDKSSVSYGMNTTGTAEYNSTTSLPLATGTFYGYVKDEAGNEGSCSATLTSTNANYKSEEKTCLDANSPEAITYEFTPIVSYYSNTRPSTENSINECNADNVGKYNISTETEYTYSWSSTSWYDGLTSCTHSNTSCASAIHQGNTSAWCTSSTASGYLRRNTRRCQRLATGYKVTKKLCSEVSNYKFSGSSASVVATCNENTVNSFQCSSSTSGQKAVSCNKTLSYSYSLKESYTTTSPPSSTSSACTNSTIGSYKISCSGPTDGSYSCKRYDCEGTSAYTKIESTCVEVQYKLGTSTKLENLPSCTNNTFTCDSSHVGQTYRTCTLVSTTCDSGTKLNNNYCYTLN